MVSKKNAVSLPRIYSTSKKDHPGKAYQPTEEEILVEPHHSEFAIVLEEAIEDEVHYISCCNP